MGNLKKAIINHSIQTSIIYILSYLYRSFMLFEFKNPFQWILNIPEATIEERGLGLFGFIFYLVFSIGVWFVIISNKELNK